MSTVDLSASLALKYAGMAPSGHNAQPWEVKVAANQRWALGLSSERCLPQVDPENREALLSLGAFLENLLTAAPAFGLDFEYSVNPEIALEPSQKAKPGQALIQLSYRRRGPASVDLKVLENRRTLRRGFLSTPLPANDQRDLGAIYYPEGSPESAAIGRLVLGANYAQINRDPAQQELSHWIRWSSRDVAAHQNGLTPDSLEIKGLARFFVKRFYKPATVLKPYFRDASLNLVRQQVKEGAGWMILTSRSNSVADLVEAGRTYEKFLLQAVPKKLGVHPMSQVLEEEGYPEQLAQDLGIQEPIQFVLRVGYVKRYPAPVSPRMDVGKFVVNSF